jgi:hypothetical protein
MVIVRSFSSSAVTGDRSQQQPQLPCVDQVTHHCGNPEQAAPNMMMAIGGTTSRVIEASSQEEEPASVGRLGDEANSANALMAEWGRSFFALGDENEETVL